MTLLKWLLQGFRMILLVLGGHIHVALENIALRQHVTVQKRDVRRRKLDRWANERGRTSFTPVAGQGWFSDSFFSVPSLEPREKADAR